MRKAYHAILKTFFHQYLLHTRAATGLTQSQMAERLAMDDRSYIELDHGKSCCSAITLALFLIASFREILGAGQWVGHTLYTSGRLFAPVSILVSPPGAFFVLAFIMAVRSKMKIRADAVDACSHNCMNCPLNSATCGVPEKGGR